MIAEHVLHRHALRNRVLAHGNPRRACHVIFRDLAAFALVVSAHETDRLAINHGHDTLPVAVEGEFGDRRPVLLHFHEAILRVVNQMKGVVADVTRGLIPVGVIRVRVAVRIRHRVDVVGIEILQIQTSLLVEIASGGIIDVGFGSVLVQLPTGEAIQSVVIVDAGLARDAVRDLRDVANRIVLIRDVLQRASDERMQASALLVPGVVVVGLRQSVAEGAGQQASRGIVRHGRDVVRIANYGNG
ncbi:MAG: hypothetical protein PGMFKBFP_02849 [Anaerolineales bacterium]|nr:hypothetical protein [Anaerolineales bacterium]